MTVLTFEVPLPPANLNARDHWAVKRKKRLVYWETLDTLVTVGLLPRAPRIAWRKAEAAVQMRTWRKADIDNCYGRMKDLGDWLQSRGYIANDRELEIRLDNCTAPRALMGVTMTLREVA